MRVHMLASVSDSRSPHMDNELDRVGTWRLWLTLTARRRMPLLAALGMTFVAVVAELVPFWLLYRAIDVLLTAPRELGHALLPLAGGTVAALLVKYLAYGSAYLISHHAAYGVMADTRSRLVDCLSHAPISWLHEQGAGALKQSVIQDVERMEAFLAHHTVEVTAAVLAPLCVTLLLFWMDWRLALATLAVGPLALLCAAIFMCGSRRDHDRFNHATAELNSVTVEYLRNMPVMKVFCHAGAGFRLLQQCLRDYYQLAESITRRVVPGWSLFASVLGAHMLLVLPLGAWLHSAGEVEAAQVALALMLGAGVYRPMLKVSRFFMEMPVIFAGLRRMAPILAFDRRAKPTSLPATPPFEVELTRVSYQYRQQPVLTEVSLRLRPGSFNVLLGPSGSGKSTLAQIVAGVLVPQSGEANVNGQAIADLDDADRAAIVGLTTQDVFLFQGTVRENLCLGRSVATDDEVRKALRVAQAESFVHGLPSGYDTPINELGARLSGGERQRLSVARALLADTPVLVLDEATAFADSMTQRAFFLALRTEYPRKTLLVIAHRLYGIEAADQILVLERGRLSARGRHTELCRESAYYRAMWRCEALNEEWALSSAGSEMAHG